MSSALLFMFIFSRIRAGKILAQVAMKFLVPVVRQSLADCQRMAAIFAERHCDTREASQLYAAWRKGAPAMHWGAPLQYVVGRWQDLGLSWSWRRWSGYDILGLVQAIGSERFLFGSGYPFRDSSLH